MQKTLELIPGDPPRLRLTLTNESGDSLSDEQLLEEAEEDARVVIAMVRLGRPKNSRRGC